jgi:acyl carrier protein
MTTPTAVADKIRSALGRELKRDPQTITLDQALREDLGLNSLDAIELMFKVEEEFDIEIPDPDLQKLRTVGDLVTYLEARLAGSPSPLPAAAPTAPAAVQGSPPPASARAASKPKRTPPRRASGPRAPVKRSRA